MGKFIPATAAFLFWLWYGQSEYQRVWIEQAALVGWVVLVAWLVGGQLAKHVPRMGAIAFAVPAIAGIAVAFWLWPVAHAPALPTPTPSPDEIADAVEKRRAETAALIEPQLFMLFERDPESWPPRRYGSPSFALNESIVPPLEIAVGERRRFNPQLAISPKADNLRQAVVFLYFPIAIFAKPDAVVLPIPLPNNPQWKFTEDRTMQNVIAYVGFGDRVKGSNGAPDQKDVFYLTPSTEGPAVIRYEITGVAERVDQALRIVRTFTVVARKPTP